MFSYRPPKGSCWGHATRPRDPVKAAEKLHVFFDRYFEPPEGEKPTDFCYFASDLAWKNSVLPNVEWAEAFLQPVNEQMMRTSFLVSLGNDGGHISFMTGILFPISPEDPASYEFLGRFSGDAPFKMNPKHFQVAIPIGKKRNFAWRKPDQVVAARLNEVIK
jgi:hypothetical protein